MKSNPPFFSIPLQRALWVAVWLAAFAFTFRETVMSGFDLLPGDELDGRLILRLQEHWFRVFSGETHWQDLGMFYPVDYGLGFSDTFFLYGIVFSIFRAFGFDIYSAAALNYAVLTFLGYAGLYLLAHRFFRFRASTATALAALFVVLAPINISGQYSHVQMFSVWYLPLAICLVLYARYGEGVGKRWACLLLSACFFALLFFNAFYVPWFFVLYLMFFAMACFILHVGRRFVASDSGQWIKTDLSAMWHWVVTYRWWVVSWAVVFSLFLVPFFAAYLPVLADSDGHPFSLVFSSLPSPGNFFNFGNLSYLWGGGSFPAAASSSATNLGYGFPLFTGLATLLLIVYSLFFYRNTRGGFRSTIVIRSMALSVVLTWLTMLRIGDFTLWRWVYEFVPAGSVIRVVFRMNAILCIPVLILWGLGIESVGRWLSRPTPYQWALVKVAVVLALASILLVEQRFVERGPTAREWTLSRSALTAREERFESPPASAGAFFVLPYRNSEEAWVFRSQMEAWSIAQRWSLKTLNGHSGILPTDFRLSSVYSQDYTHRYLREVKEWVYAHNLDKSSLYYLDLETGEWGTYEQLFPADELPQFGLGQPISFAEHSTSESRERASTALEYGWSGIEPTHVWTEEREARIALRIEGEIGSPAFINFEAFAFVENDLKSQSFAIYSGADLLGEFKVKHHYPAQCYSVEVPSRLLEQEVLFLRILCPDAASPLEVSGHNDPRLLGLGLVGLSLASKPCI